MRKVIVFVLVMLSFSLHALEVEGVKLPDTMQLGESKLVLNGAGTRSKFFIDLYVGSLYLQKKNNVSNDVINAEEKMVIRLDITSSMISSEKMTKATLEGFENATNDNISPIKTEIDKFMSAFSEEIKEGDTFGFAYVPTEGVVVTKNGTIKETISSKPFKRALFGIWLSDDPAQDSLKEKMLGR